MIQKTKYFYTYYDNQTDEEWLATKKAGYTSPTWFYLTISEEGKDLGNCLVKLTKGYYNILSLSIIPSMRGKGYGTQLIGYVKSLGKDIKINSEIDAVKFYEKLGFVTTNKITREMKWIFVK